MKKWWFFELWWKKNSLKKIASFFKTARKHLHCVVWYYKTHGVDYHDVLRSLYHWIWVILHFAVSERLVTSHFFKNDMKIRKNTEIKIRRRAIDILLSQHVALQIWRYLKQLSRQVFLSNRWIITVVSNSVWQMKNHRLHYLAMLRLFYRAYTSLYLEALWVSRWTIDFHDAY